LSLTAPEFLLDTDPDPAFDFDFDADSGPDPPPEMIQNRIHYIDLNSKE
jgi:hypothetical protein